MLRQKIQEIQMIEARRYSLKGAMNIMTAVGLLGSIFSAGWLIGCNLWPQEIEDKSAFFVMNSINLHIVTHLVCFFLYLPGYLGVELYKKYQINPKTLWPWEKSGWRKFLTKILSNVLLNNVIIYPFLFYFSGVNEWKLRFDSFPSLLQLFVQVIIIYYLEDFFVFWAHYLSHVNKHVYKIHKIHHQFQKVVTIANEFSHPLDIVLGNLIPHSLVFIIMGARVHCFTFFFWAVFKLAMSCQGHSGYEVPWSPFRVLPFVFGPTFHDYHHSKNVGNYAGSCYIWDAIFGTSKEFFSNFINAQSKKQ